MILSLASQFPPSSAPLIVICIYHEDSLLDARHCGGVSQVLDQPQALNFALTMHRQFLITQAQREGAILYCPLRFSPLQSK